MAALDEVAQSLAAGQPTYVHDVSGPGHSMLVAGLWMLQSGSATAADVVQRLSDLPDGGDPKVTLPDRRDYRDYLAAARRSRDY